MNRFPLHQLTKGICKLTEKGEVAIAILWRWKMKSGMFWRDYEPA
jgi:hypothetical protein